MESEDVDFYTGQMSKDYYAFFFYNKLLCLIKVLGVEERGIEIDERGYLSLLRDYCYFSGF